MGRKVNAPKANIQTHWLFDRRRITNFDSMTLAKLMLISSGCQVYSARFFSALDIEKLSVEYIGGFGLMRHQVGHAVD